MGTWKRYKKRGRERRRRKKESRDSSCTRHLMVFEAAQLRCIVALDWRGSNFIWYPSTSTSLQLHFIFTASLGLHQRNRLFSSLPFYSISSNIPIPFVELQQRRSFCSVLETPTRPVACHRASPQPEICRVPFSLAPPSLGRKLLEGSGGRIIVNEHRTYKM